MAIRNNKTMVLPDGRLLGYDECGVLDEGLPVLLFHDVLSSRVGLAGEEQDAVAERLGVRLVAVDRPGIGASTPRPDRTILDWPIDVVAFAEQLGLSRFAALGFGSASAYVVACAVRIPHRLLAAGVIAGAAPVDASSMDLAPRAIRQFSRAARRFGFLLERALARMAHSYASNPSAAGDGVLVGAGPADSATLMDAARRHQLVEAVREGFRLGTAGPMLDLQLLLRPWRFSLAEVPLIINLWYGEQDMDTPPAGTRLLASLLPRSETKCYPSEGHYSLYRNRLDDMLEGLLATARREQGKPVG